MSRLLSSLAVIAGLLLTGSAAQAMDITTCGQRVPRGETGVLQADLDCELSPGPRRCREDIEIICSSDSDCPGGIPFSCRPAEAVTLGDYTFRGRAHLELNGHSIRGAYYGIKCYVGRCTIRGPGEVSGSKAAIRAGRHLTIENVVASDSRFGIRTNYNRGRLELTDVVVRDITYSGVVAKKLLATNLSVINSESGIEARTIVGTNITVENNEVGIGAYIHLRKAVINGLEATNNSIVGVTGKRVRLQNSLLQDNGVDLLTLRRPRLVNTTCSTSEVCEGHGIKTCPSTGESWQVCTDD